MPGTSTSTVEVTNISKHGFWLLLDGRELCSRSKNSPGSPAPQSRQSCGSSGQQLDTSVGPASTST